MLGLPGIPAVQDVRSRDPSGDFVGLAKKPKGWSFLHCFLSSCSLILQSEDMICLCFFSM